MLIEAVLVERWLVKTTPIFAQRSTCSFYGSTISLSILLKKWHCQGKKFISNGMIHFLIYVVQGLVYPRIRVSSVSVLACPSRRSSDEIQTGPMPQKHDAFQDIALG